jgi:hypothetical protein
LPTPADIHEFLDTARSLNLNAANFWEWSRVRSEELSEVWDAIRDHPWIGGPVPTDIVDHYIAGLNSRDPVKLSALYGPNAAHITANHTISGKQAIRSWFQNLFDHILPDGQFTLTGYAGLGNSRHFTWSANSSHGQVENGNDVFGLLDGKIVYHYSFFTVT